MAAAGLLPSPSQIAFGLGLVVIVMGLAITVLALQGARRNDSRPMLLLAVGIALVTVVPSLLEIVLQPVVVRWYPAGSSTLSVLFVVSRLSEAVGIAALLGSVYARR